MADGKEVNPNFTATQKETETQNDLVGFEVGPELEDDIDPNISENVLGDDSSVKNEVDIELPMSVADETEKVSSLGEPLILEEGEDIPEQQAGSYIKPIEDPYEKATKYLSKHDILQLFQVLTAGIAYRKPKDPIDYMITEIEGIRDLDRLRKGVIRKANAGKDSVMRSDTR